MPNKWRGRWYPLWTRNPASVQTLDTSAERASSVTTGLMLIFLLRLCRSVVVSCPIACRHVSRTGCTDVRPATILNSRTPRAQVLAVALASRSSDEESEGPRGAKPTNSGKQHMATLSRTEPSAFLLYSRIIFMLFLDAVEAPMKVCHSRHGRGKDVISNILQGCF